MIITREHHQFFKWCTRRPVRSITKTSRVFVLIATLFLAIVTPGTSIHAETAEDFYLGRSIRWIVPYRPGGGYDQYTRLLTPFFEKYSGARVDIVNMPGGGGMRGAVETFRSPPDGLHLGLINGAAMVGNEIAGMPGAEYSVADYSYVGRISSGEERILVLSAKSEFSSFDEIQNMESGREVVIGSTGKGGTSYVDAVVMGHVFGYRQKVIYGFNSSADIRLALLRGDIDGMWGSIGSALEDIVAGDLKPVLRSGDVPYPELDKVPSVLAVSHNASAASKVLLDAWNTLRDMGRALVAPPDVPSDRLNFLREALRKAMADPDFVKAARLSKRDIAYLGGEETRRLANRGAKLDDATRQLLAAVLRGEL